MDTEYPQRDALQSKAMTDTSHRIAKITLNRIGEPSGWSVRAAYTGSSVVVVLVIVSVAVVLVDDVTVVPVTVVDVCDVVVAVVVMPSSVVVVADVVVVLEQTPHITGHVVLANDPKSLSRLQFPNKISFPHTDDSKTPKQSDVLYGVVVVVSVVVVVPVVVVVEQVPHMIGQTSLAWSPKDDVNAQSRM